MLPIDRLVNDLKNKTKDPNEITHLGCMLFIVFPMILVFSTFMIVIAKKIWNAVVSDIDIAFRLCKLDVRFVYDQNTGAKWTMTSSEVESTEPWKVSDFGMSNDEFDTVLTMAMVIMWLILTMMTDLHFHLFHIVSTFMNPFAAQYYFEYRNEIYKAIVLHLYTFTITYLVLLVIYHISWIKFEYCAKWSISFNLLRLINLKVDYHHDKGFDCVMMPIPTPVIQSKTEVKRDNIYRQLVDIQWKTLAGKYDLNERYIALCDDMINDNNPLFKENIVKLGTLGYDVIHKDKGICLKFNGDKTQRPRFVKHQKEKINLKYMNRQCIDIDLCDINDEDCPLFEENIALFKECGYEVSYQMVDVADKWAKCRQARLQFVINDKESAYALILRSQLRSC